MKGLSEFFMDNRGYFFLMIVIVCLCLVLVVLYCSIKCRTNNQNDVLNRYEIFCIENIKYVQINGVMSAKYGLDGEIETCELSEFD